MNVDMNTQFEYRFYNEDREVVKETYTMYEIMSGALSWVTLSNQVWELIDIKQL